MNFQRNRTFNFQLGTRHLCCDGYQYETKPQTNGGRGYAELLFFPTAEGYVKALYHPDVSHHEPKEYQYIYIYKDHLGNNRLSYTFDPETEQVKILEEKHYYPFGLKHGNYNAIRKDVKYQELAASKKEVKQVVPDVMKFKYLYNSKELQDELGLNWYDYGLRMYSPSIGRWNGIDPLIEKYFPLSPYNFVANNPLTFRDIYGMDIVGNNGKTLVTVDENGKIQFTKYATKRRNAGSIKIIKAMLKTTQGKIIVKNLIKSKTKTKFNLTNKAYFKIISDKSGNKSLMVALGFTNYGRGEMGIDKNGIPYFKNATITIYKGSFDVINGNMKSLPNKAQGLKVVNTVGMKKYTNFTKFLNGIGVHEGTHVLNDITDAMNNLGIDAIKVEGKEARKLFIAIKNYLRSDEGVKSKEKVPIENERKSRNEMNND